jgi:DNA-binding response OmpR family regulator
MSSVLVVEDDDRIRLALQLALEDEGYGVVAAPSAEAALLEYSREATDAVLVDLMLPGMDGFECIRQLRRGGSVPIIVVSARQDTHDIVAALEAGADDYLVKPVKVKELSARLRALRRRAQPVAADVEALVFDDLELRPDAGEVRLDGSVVALTKTEFRLLCVLAVQPGRVLTRRQLLEQVWEYDFGDDRVVDVQVGRLRRKIERDPAVPKHLLTVRGFGYKFT